MFGFGLQRVAGVRLGTVALRMLRLVHVRRRLHRCGDLRVHGLGLVLLLGLGLGDHLLRQLAVSGQTGAGGNELAARVKAFPEVESVCLMSGGFDLAVTVTANTMSEIAMFVAKRLAPIDGVLSTATHFILTKYKDGGVDFVTDYDEIDERGSNLCD